MTDHVESHPLLSNVPDIVTDYVPSSGIVVGDDGSETATVAIAEAAREAQLRKLPLHIVRTWSIRTAPRPETRKHGAVPSLHEYEHSIAQNIEARVKQVIPAETLTRLEVHYQPVHGSPAKALIRASEKADLLVVGTRGLGGFAGLILGSVADQCVKYSHCPVLVARGELRPSE